MLSRVADSIYWMSRCVERAENLARFVDVTMHLILDLPDGAAETWKPLVDTTGERAFFDELYEEATQENVVRFLSFDSRYPNSIISCLRNARENARSVREAIASEMWEHLNQFYFMVKDAAECESPPTNSSDFFDEVKMASHLFKGIADSSMSRGEGWHFARLGRMIERADKTSRILDVKYYVLLPRLQYVGSTIDDLQWSAVLRSVSALEMYRKQFHGLSPHRVVEFLLLDREFPRAIQHCVIAADESLHAISGTVPGSYRNIAEQRMGQLRSELAYISVDDVISSGLHEFIDNLQMKLNAIGDGIFDTFITMRPVESQAAQQ